MPQGNAAIFLRSSYARDLSLYVQKVETTKGGEKLRTIRFFSLCFCVTLFCISFFYSVYDVALSDIILSLFDVLFQIRPESQLAGVLLKAVLHGGHKQRA